MESHNSGGSSGSSAAGASGAGRSGSQLGWRIGQLAGVRLTVQPSWLALAALVLVGFAAAFGAAHPQAGGWRFAWAAGFLVAFSVSILLHELAHAVVARRSGLPVEEIRVGFVAAGTTLGAERRSPGQEFWVAATGPLTSLGIGGLALAGWRAAGPGQLGFALAALVGLNALVGIGNLLPGLPLDGGWMVRAGVWKVTGDPHLATIVAAWCGRVLAIGLLAAPMVAYLGWQRQLRLLELVIAVIVAVFAWFGATISLRQARLRRRLPLIGVRSLARRAIAVQQDTPVAEAVRLARLRAAGALVVCDGSDQPVGLVSEPAVASLPPDQQPWVECGEVATRLRADLVIGVNDTGEEVLATWSQRPDGEFLVVDERGQVFGVLVGSDLERAFAGRR